MTSRGASLEQARPFAPARALSRWTDGGWLVLTAGLGIVAGVVLPMAFESVLELYFAVLGLIVVLGLLAMPRKLTFNDGACWALFIVLLALFSLYPHYISLRISGLPWISPIRLVFAVLLLIWLYALRTSPDMQQNIGRYIRENRLFFIFFGIFLVAQALSVPTAIDVRQALTKFLLFQLYWTFPLFVALSLFRTERRLHLLLCLFIAFAAIQCLVGFLEARQERLLWLDYLPPGFGADNEAILRAIQGQFRADGYRVQGSFSVSLVYAEFLVLMLPFALYAFMEGRYWTLRIAGLLTALMILPAQYLSGSRLGMVGTIVVFLALSVIYVVRIWRTDKRSMAGPFLVLMLPFALAAFAGAYVSSPRLQAMTIGGGQHQASTDSRFEQAEMAAPKILSRPLFGHGTGMGAEALGFLSPSGILTIDTYVISVLLEVGIVGFIGYFGMIFWAIQAGARTYMGSAGGPGRLGGPLALSLTAFLIIKLVLSQVDTHMLIFLMMAIVMVIRRQDAEAQQIAEPPQKESAPFHRKARRDLAWAAGPAASDKAQHRRRKNVRYEQSAPLRIFNNS